MKRILPFVLAACTSPLFAQSEKNPLAELDWKFGPTTAKVGSVASQRVEDGYAFLEAPEVRKFDELIQEPYLESEVAVIAPDDLSWFAVYSWDPIGYVKDGEKGSLDSRAIFEAIREGTAEGNAERRRHGWPELKLVGWSREPHYDETTHNLEWALLFDSEGERSVNYNTRILGRGGVMSVMLVCRPEDLIAARKISETIHISDELLSYIADIVIATRKRGDIAAGVSSRGTLALMRAARASAFLEGRDYVVPEDIKYLAEPVLAHRLILFRNYRQTMTQETILREIIESVPVPTEDFRK